MVTLASAPVHGPGAPRWSIDVGLAHRLYVGSPGNPARWGFVLHGFLGQGRNWEGIARRLVAARGDLGLIVPDLRLHGESREAPPPHTLAACVADLDALAQSLGVTPDFVLGHSFGGKVALAWARGRVGVSQVWVLDSTPAPLPPGGAAHEMMARLRRLPGPVGSRGEMVARLEADGLDRGTAQWVATNLVQGPEGWGWGLDLDGLDGLLADFFAADLWPVLEHPVEGAHIHLVKATRSDLLTPPMLERSRRAAATHGQVEVHLLDSGHWVNVGNPEGLLALLTPRL